MNPTLLKYLSVLLLFFFTGKYSVAEEPNICIALTINNIRNNDGHILVTVFNQSKGFPSDSTMAYHTYILKAVKPEVNLLIDNLTSGEYAIALVHDENSNHLLDTNLVGAPVEGYAASGSNKRFSAPKFETSKFNLEKNIEMKIEMKYLF